MSESLYLYTFHKNNLRVFECEPFKNPAVYPKKDINLRYLRKKGDKSRRIVSKDEGVVYANQLWLSKKDYQKAIDCFIKSKKENVSNLELEISKIKDQITNLYCLRGPEKKKKKRFQIRDRNGNIIDKDLSYEAALLYIDNSIGKYYIMEPMKEDDQNGCCSL